MPHKPDPEQVVKDFGQRYQAAYAKREEWLKEACEMQRLYDGNQWDDQDKNRLKAGNRPALVFNRIAPMIDVVVGSEASAGLEGKFVPRTVTNRPQVPTDDDTMTADIANEANRYFRQVAGADYEENKAKGDLSRVGMGWVNTRIDTESDPEIMIAIERVPWKQMLWDPNARKQNLLDAEYVICEQILSKASFDARWPGKMDQVETSVQDSTDMMGVSTRNADYSETRAVSDKSLWEKNQVRVCEYQWATLESYWRILDPRTNEPRLIPDEEMKAQQKALKDRAKSFAAQPEPPIPGPAPVAPFLPPDPMTGMHPPEHAAMMQAHQQATGMWQQMSQMRALYDNEAVAIQNEKLRLDAAVELKKRCYYRAFIGSGSTTLSDPEWLPSQSGFSYQCMTGNYDEEKGIFYGLIRPLKDPQTYINKTVSLLVEIISSGAKGGLMIEEGAVANMAEFQKNFASPWEHVKIAPGGLAKIGAKPGTQLNPQLAEMFQLASAAPGQVTAINPAMMGNSGANTPVGTVAQYRRQGASAMQTYLDAIRRYHEKQCRVMLDLLRVMPKRLIRRIAGPEAGQWLEFDSDRLAPNYDLIVDEAPDSPNMKSEVFQTLQILLPTFAKAGMPPQLLTEFLEFAPLPATLIQRIREMMAAVPPQAEIVPPNPGEVSAAMGQAAPRTDKEPIRMGGLPPMRGGM